MRSRGRGTLLRRLSRLVVSAYRSVQAVSTPAPSRELDGARAASAHLRSRKSGGVAKAITRRSTNQSQDSISRSQPEFAIRQPRPRYREQRATHPIGCSIGRGGPADAWRQEAEALPRREAKHGNAMKPLAWFQLRRREVRLVRRVGEVLRLQAEACAALICDSSLSFY
jgi:hypothetical protein